jgi:hypothetical protein
MTLHMTGTREDWLGLAASPSFAIMALVTGLLGDGTPDLLCSSAHMSSLGGMVPMYLLMSAFHLAPWLKLVSRRSARIQLNSGAPMSAENPDIPRSTPYPPQAPA